MTNTPTYPYHLAALRQSESTAQVEAVVVSIKATVQPGHAEYEPLLETGRKRWKELAGRIESKEAK